MAKPDHSGTVERHVDLRGRHRQAQGPDRQGHLQGDDDADGTGGAEVEGEYSVPK